LATDDGDPLGPRITTFHCKDFADAIRPAERFISGHAALVILEAEAPNGRRIVDFCPGTAGGRGTFERIAPLRFLMIPAGVKISATQRSDLTI
jgi:FtsZ-interacting cell division protein YlmF